MRPTETIEQLTRFERRVAGSDAELRAARWLADQLGQSGRDARLEPFWSRSNWALAHAWHVALALAGSIVSVHAPRIGGALVLAALLSVILDSLTGVSIGRRLTPERASQNVVSAPNDSERGKPLRLLITANYDAGRTGLVYRDGARRMVGAVRRPFGAGPGWLGWLSMALLWLLAIAILRLGGTSGTGVGVAQLIPTVALVLALALLLDLASAEVSPAAGDNASGVAVALALARALDAAPPRRVAVELVLQGASDASAVGLRRHLRARTPKPKATDTVVLGVAPCAAGSLRWWHSDGQLIPLRYLTRLRELCARVAAQEPELGAQRHRGRGATPALPARAASLPAIAIGCLDGRELPPRSHQRGDTPEEIDSATLDATVEFGLLLVDAIDGFLRRQADSGGLKPAAAPVAASR